MNPAKTPGPAAICRLSAGLLNTLALLALLAVFAPFGTETQGGTIGNPPPAFHSAAVRSSASSGRAS